MQILHPKHHLTSLPPRLRRRRKCDNNQINSRFDNNHISEAIDQPQLTNIPRSKLFYKDWKLTITNHESNNIKRNTGSKNLTLWPEYLVVPMQFGCRIYRWVVWAQYLVDGACGWWLVGGSRSNLVGAVDRDTRVTFGGRRCQILSYVHGWASPMLVRGAVRCRVRVPFVVGTEREVSGSRRGEMKHKNKTKAFFISRKFNFFFLGLTWTTPHQQEVDAGWTAARCIELLCGPS